MVKLKRKKIKYGSYFLVDEKGREVARVDKTGTHLDDYPWDWYLMDGFEFDTDQSRRSGGVEESLKAVVDTVSSRIEQYGFTCDKTGGE